MLYIVKSNFTRLRPAIFMGPSRQAIKNFPEPARRAAGWQIRDVQRGREPDDWKPMVSIGPGAKEIRLHKPNEYRVIYIEHFVEALYILHAFQKKTQKTQQRHIEVARSMYAKAEKARKIKN
jgi:phage-related protein